MDTAIIAAIIGAVATITAAIISLIAVLWVKNRASDEPSRDEHLIPSIDDSRSIEAADTPDKGLVRSGYDSSSEAEPFTSWRLCSSSGNIYTHITTVSREEDGAVAFKLLATASEHIGVDKPFPVLWGEVAFEYSVGYSRSDGPNVLFYMIPMQETGLDRTGVIEAGTDVQDDPRNVFSPYRVRYVVPTRHYGDGEWHKASIEFDFRDTPGAFYSIFAPRINEGSVHPGEAALFLTNVVLFSQAI
jgi:hypothetical protein